MRGAIRRVAVLAAACLTYVVPTARAATPAPPCERLAVSSNYAHDHTAFCFARLWNFSNAGPTWIDGNEVGTQVWMTYDGGRTWKPRSTFVTSDNQHGYGDDVVGVWYVASGDRQRLFVAADSGLYVSDDRGMTYHWLDSQAVPPYTGWGPWGFRPSHLTPFVGTFAPVGGVKLAGTMFGYAGGYQSALVDTDHEAHVPVAGAGIGTVAFLLPNDFGTAGHALAVGASPVDGDLVSQLTTDTPPVEGLYDCPAALACARKLAVFPANRAVDGVWLAPDFPASHRLWASHRPAEFNASLGDLVVQESTDGGATLHTWASVDAILKPARAEHATYLDVDVIGAGGHTLYLAVVAGRSSSATGWPPVPQFQLFRSTDDGRTWARRAYLFVEDGTSVLHTRGTLPFGFGRAQFGWGPPAPSFAAAADGTLLAHGSPMTHWYGSTFWCSRDAGAHWQRACPR